MKYLGYEISEDGATQWRNNGGIIERRALYASGRWKTVAETTCTPHTRAELQAYCGKNDCRYARNLRHPNRS